MKKRIILKQIKKRLKEMYGKPYRNSNYLLIKKNLKRYLSIKNKRILY